MLALLVILLLGGFFRGAGLFRGLDNGVVYHPDTPKQVRTLHNYLDGKYVQYYGSLFYDGYPYGLNRVDEGVIRTVRAVARPVHGWINPETPWPRSPTQTDLYYWARVLRLLYGVLAIGLVYLVLRLARAGPEAAVAGAAVYALAPLGPTVTHAASGDIGVDLFLSFCLVALALYVRRPRAVYLVGAGLSCGMAFACKYQGALGMWLPGVALLALHGRSWRGAAGAVARGMWCMGGFLAGVLLLNPAYLVDPAATWKYTRKNFIFIKNYGADPAFLEQPLFDRLQHGLLHNVPFVIGCLGWGLIALILVGCVVAVVRVLRPAAVEEDAGGAMPSRDAGQHALLAATVTFPVMAILLSAALKPSVQPFHFSYLVPVMGTGIGLLMATGAVLPRVARVAVGVVLVVVLSAESLPMLLREHFMWRRPEVSMLSFRVTEHLFRADAGPSRRMAPPRAIKMFYNDPTILPVFRNRASSIEHREVDWWRAFPVLPLPVVPQPEAPAWVFFNGPVLPRCDRLIRVPAQSGWHEHQLVFHARPEEIKVGLRAGYYPSRYAFRIAGQRHEGIVSPHGQSQVLTIADPDPAYVKAAHENRPDLYIYLLRTRAELGDLWVRVMHEDAERAWFETFGPQGVVQQPIPESARLEAMARRVEATRYLEGKRPVELRIEGATLTDEAIELAAGPFMLEARVTHAGAPQKLTFWAEDEGGYAYGMTPSQVAATSGASRVRWHFVKRFTPYSLRLFAASEREDVTIEGWTLYPDLEGLTNWTHEPVPAPVRVTEDETLAAGQGVVYPKLGRWMAFRLPTVLARGEVFDYEPVFDPAPDISVDDFFGAAYFLHIKNEAGDVVKALDFPLKDGSFVDGPARVRQSRIDPEAVPPGRYRVEGGLFFVRKRVRFAFDRPDGMDADVGDRVLRLGTVEIR